MCLRILTTHKYLMQNNSIKTAASHSGFWFRVNSYMLPHRHCTCLICVTDSDRYCICRRTPAHNRWNRRMSCRLCGHSLRYCREEVCFLLHYPYISPSLCAGYCSSNFKYKLHERTDSLYPVLYAHRKGIQVINNLFSGKIFRLCNRF